MDQRRLTRSRSNRIIAGVCGGLGNYFGVNPWIFRILFVLLVFPGGVPGLLLYFLLALVMPLD
jgi:phage shock protein C